MHRLAYSARQQRSLYWFLTMKRIALFLIVIGAIAFAILFASSERNRAALLSQEGFITEGSKFGVSVGQTTESAATTLRRANWQYIETKNGGYCYRHVYSTATKVVVFFDESWRKTTFCLGTKDGHVISIQWNADPFTPDI